MKFTVLFCVCALVFGQEGLPALQPVPQLTRVIAIRGYDSTSLSKAYAELVRAQEEYARLSNSIKNSYAKEGGKWSFSSDFSVLIEQDYYHSPGLDWNPKWFGDINVPLDSRHIGTCAGTNNSCDEHPSIACINGDPVECVTSGTGTVVR